MICIIFNTYSIPFADETLTNQEAHDIDSDNSSCEESEQQLLKDMIQAAMPKGKGNMIISIFFLKG